MDSFLPYLWVLALPLIALLAWLIWWNSQQMIARGEMSFVSGVTRIEQIDEQLAVSSLQKWKGDCIIAQYVPGRVLELRSAGGWSRRTVPPFVLMTIAVLILAASVCIGQQFYLKIRSTLFSVRGAVGVAAVGAAMVFGILPALRRRLPDSAIFEAGSSTVLITEKGFTEAIPVTDLKEIEMRRNGDNQDNPSPDRSWFVILRAKNGRQWLLTTSKFRPDDAFVICGSLLKEIGQLTSLPLVLT